ncbi:hypothetical protein AB0I28_27345 [Phytomonospora sp. NPDC050363]|uniref:hypothetical protein n=1 Tax=Phytomonospora sp. NPDC050363 TaxID=3155642 RepID=UPI0033C31577
MDLRIELDAAEGDETALSDLTGLLRDEGVPYRLAESDDPLAMGPDPIAIVNAVLAGVNTICAVATLVVNLRAGRAGRIVAPDGRKAPIGREPGELGETLHGWIFPDGPKEP